jgi:hypothetical protein
MERHDFILKRNSTQYANSTSKIKVRVCSIYYESKQDKKTIYEVMDRMSLVIFLNIFVSFFVC